MVLRDSLILHGKYLSVPGKTLSDNRIRKPSMTCVPAEAAPAPEPAPEPEPEVPQHAPSAWRTIPTRGSRRSRRTQAAPAPPPPEPVPPPATQSWATWQRKYCRNPTSINTQILIMFSSEPCLPTIPTHPPCRTSPGASSGQPGIVWPPLSSRLHCSVVGFMGPDGLCMIHCDLVSYLTTSRLSSCSPFASHVMFPNLLLRCYLPHLRLRLCTIDAICLFHNDRTRLNDLLGRRVVASL